MLRDLYFKQIETVKEGRDPKGVIRDEKQNQLIVMGGTYKWISADERKQIEQSIAA